MFIHTPRMAYVVEAQFQPHFVSRQSHSTYLSTFLLAAQVSTQAEVPTEPLPVLQLPRTEILVPKQGDLAVERQLLGLLLSHGQMGERHDERNAECSIV